MFSTTRIPVTSLTEVLARPEELPNRREFRIGTYNAWNLFGDRPDVHASRPSEPADEEQLEALGEKILGLDADAIAFQEVQNEKVLEKLFREHVNGRLDAGQRYTAFVCIPAKDPRGINVALATRLSVRGALTFHDREFGALDDRASHFSRDLLGVELFATPRYRFLMFVAHLKSKIGGDRAEDKRRLEVAEIRTILEEPQFGGAPYVGQDLILCGDMNDDPDSAVIAELTGGTRPGAPPLRDVLAGFKSYPTHDRYKKTRLDYILASPSIQGAVRDAEVHTDGPAVKASDHFPASATVAVRAT
jgi:endonuclease/exonuclease/phosphatase family metal-dependent hydrolase